MISSLSVRETTVVLMTRRTKIKAVVKLAVKLAVKLGLVKLALLAVRLKTIRDSVL